ncbi:RagB/SusD family nutrient uptake outer membrane protein [Hymenobacter sp. B81]|uniref:RagB/SusD family nutrient uptake outer membrane protein n=1 Tax=Hymenobacter sp. B81 TaxID=3344878 RepID=UPI0037DCED58
MKYIPNLVWRTALLGLLLTAAPGCDLLEQESPSALSPEDVFSSPDRIEKAANGMYDALQDGEFLGGRALIYNDIRSDDTDPAGFFGGLALSNATSGDANAAGAWVGGYRSMYMANYMMQELGKRSNNAGLTQEKYNQYIGEAKFIRALCHFTLVNMFAQPYNYSGNGSHPGIPIQLNAPNGEEAYLPAQQLPRSTVAQVYDQIERDLLDALAKLPVSQGSQPVSIARATQDAARGLLSRLYLYKGDLDNAKRYAGEIIASGRHELNTSAYAEFRAVLPDAPHPQQFTSESIFFVAMTINDNPNTNNAIGEHYSPPPGRGDITVTPLSRVIPATDKRRTELMVQRSGRLWTRKYSAETSTGSYGGANRGAWVPILRYPEILLTRAEVLAKQQAGDQADAEALELLNKVRDRSKPSTAASYTVASFATKQAFIDAILRERRFELAFEGHRIFDLFRNGLDVPARTGSAPAPGIPWKSDRAVLPIPANEILRNPNLTQNPGY